MWEHTLEVQLGMHLPPGLWFRGSAKPTQAFCRLCNRAGVILNHKYTPTTLSIYTNICPLHTDGFDQKPHFLAYDTVVQ